MPARVLIVEDTSSIRLMLRVKLSAAYYDVIEAADGPSALEQVRVCEPDLVLLDVMMPGIDGFEVCRQIKSDPKTLHIPVVMLTALDKRDDRVRGIEAGADDFLSKPFDDVALMSRVDSLIRMKMMVDELALRGETSQGLGVDKMIETSRATKFPESRVLVVTDSDADGRRLCECLSREIGCSVDIASGADEAKALVDFIGFDAVVIGETLEDGEPLRLGTMIRARPETRQSATLLVVKPGEQALATRALELGFNDHIASPVDQVELVARVRSQLRRKLYADQLRENMRTKLVEAITDPLTGAYNRRYADDHLEALIAQCRERGSDLAVMVLDLDNFKSVNDSFGHASGDAVLVEFARRLKDNVRGMDLVARMGGEEFLVVMPDVNPVLAAEIAERVRTSTESPAFELTQGHPPLGVTVSIGYAVLATGETADGVIARADTALYASKEAGRNRVTLALAA